MARKTLTQLTVEKFRPDPAREIERADHLYPALRLRIYPSGARSFWLRTCIAGKTANLRLEDVGLDLAKARVATRDLLARIDAGEDPRVASRKVKATTLGGVAELYLKHSADEVGPRTQVERVRHLTRDWKPLHHRPIAEIKKGEIAARLLEIKDQHGPIAANRSRTTLFGLFWWADDQDLIDVNVVASTRRVLRREPTRQRVHTADERREILDATEGEGAYNAIVRLAWLTGQRKGELGGMMLERVGPRQGDLVVAAREVQERPAARRVFEPAGDRDHQGTARPRRVRLRRAGRCPILGMVALQAPARPAHPGGATEGRPRGEADVPLGVA